MQSNPVAVRFSLARTLRHPDGRRWSIDNDGEVVKLRMFDPDDGEWMERSRTEADAVAAAMEVVQRSNEQRDEGFVDEDTALQPRREDGVYWRAVRHPDGRLGERAADGRLVWGRERDAAGKWREGAWKASDAVAAVADVARWADDRRGAGYEEAHPVWQGLVESLASLWDAAGQGEVIAPYLAQARAMPEAARERWLEAIAALPLLLLNNGGGAAAGYVEAPFETAFHPRRERALEALRAGVDEARPLLALALRMQVPPVHRTRDQLWRFNTVAGAGQAAELLTGTGDRALVPLFLACLEHVGPDDGWYITSSELLALLGEGRLDDATLARLVRLAGSPDEQSASRAASVLAEHGDEPTAFEAVWALRDHAGSRIAMAVLRLAESFPDERTQEWLASKPRTLVAAARSHPEWRERIERALGTSPATPPQTT